jgi:S-adenosylmethionine hydrolase
LADATPCFPPGTLHIAVVDPGVGTARPLVYAEIGAQRYLAPDNGLLGELLHDLHLRRAMELTNREHWRDVVSTTFHGRDILAPVAAALLNGLDPLELGPVRSQLQPSQIPRCIVQADGTILGEVILIDSFGNLATNVKLSSLPPGIALDQVSLNIRNQTIGPVRPTYGNQPPSTTIAVIDSQGRLEIAVVNGDARRQLGVEVGEPVTVRINSLSR